MRSFHLVPLLTLLTLACGGGEEAAPTQTAAPTAAQPALSPTAAAPSQMPEPRAQRIAYLDPEGYPAIIHADGSEQTRLTTATHASLPNWSPDGSRFAFYVCEPAVPPDFGPCNDRIYVVNADGSGLTRLADGGVGPALDWSPDGSRITFAAGGVSVMNADGSERATLTDIMAFGIRWSPEGTRIAFASADPVGGANSDIYVINADGTHVARLTGNADRDDNPVWSPDGTRIAFTSFREGNVDVYVMDADGAGVTRLTSGPAQDSSPAWAPDGSRITLFSTTGATIRDPNIGISYDVADIYAVRPDGSDLIKLATSALPYSLAWSPDGTRIAFTRVEPTGELAVYVMNTDGSRQTRLTQGSLPAWQPQP